ncbi:MAG: hypothetical protein QXV73_04170 [Candidatus Micrarchaeia archaeon]
MRLKNKTYLNNNLFVLIVLLIFSGCSLTQENLVVSSIKTSKPVFLDYEKLALERTIYIAPLNIKEVDVKAIEKALENKDMIIEKDPQKASYILQVFIKEISNYKIIADVLIRERPVLMINKSGAKIYPTDLDSKDYKTTIEINITEGTKEKLIEELFKQVALLFEVRR